MKYSKWMAKQKKFWEDFRSESIRKDNEFRKRWGMPLRDGGNLYDDVKFLKQLQEYKGGKEFVLDWTKWNNKHDRYRLWKTMTGKYASLLAPIPGIGSGTFFNS